MIVQAQLKLFTGLLQFLQGKTFFFLFNGPRKLNLPQKIATTFSEFLNKESTQSSDSDVLSQAKPKLERPKKLEAEILANAVNGFCELLGDSNVLVKLLKVIFSAVSHCI